MHMLPTHNQLPRLDAILLIYNQLDILELIQKLFVNYKLYCDKVGNSYITLCIWKSKGKAFILWFNFNDDKY